MYDANVTLQASTTQTATFSSTGVCLHPPGNTALTNAGGTPRYGLKARCRVTAISGTTPTVSFKVQHADDNATWTDLAYQVDAALTATGVTYINFDTDKSFVRVVATIGGTTPSVTYAVDLGLARP